MANPRKLVEHIGIGFRADSFIADGSTITHSSAATDGSAVAGLAVGLVAGTEDTIELVQDGQAVLGKLLHVEPDGVCAVQVEGVCELPGGTSATLTRGGAIVGALNTAARGYIRAVAPATLSDVAAGRHRIEKASTASAVEVRLGV